MWVSGKQLILQNDESGAPGQRRLECENRALGSYRGRLIALWMEQRAVAACVEMEEATGSHYF